MPMRSVHTFLILSSCLLIGACSGSGGGAASPAGAGGNPASTNGGAPIKAGTPPAAGNPGATPLPAATPGGNAGSGGAPSAPAPTPAAYSPEGLWEGTWTSSDGVSESMYAIVTPSDGIRFIDQSPSAIYVGSYAMQGNTGDGTLTGYAPVAGSFPDGSKTASMALKMSMAAADSLTGSLTGGGYSGSFKLAPKAGYRRGSSLGLLAGQWQYTDPAGSDNVTLSVDAAGTLSGKDGQGCVYSGTAALTDTRVNIYRLRVDVSQCGNYDGAYTGLAGLSDKNGGTNNELLATISNPGQAFALSLLRQ